jgi:hypothetical protein
MLPSSFMPQAENREAAVLVVQVVPEEMAAPVEAGPLGVAAGARVQPDLKAIQVPQLLNHLAREVTALFS